MRRELIATTRRVLQAPAHLGASARDPGESLVLVGTPRSGTTWLAEVLAAATGRLINFEPCNLTLFPEAARAGLEWRTVVEETGADDQRREYVQAALAGRVGDIRSPRSGPSRFVHPLATAPILLKSVRLTRSFGWLSHRFSTRGCLLVVRNPVSVVASQLALSRIHPTGWDRTPRRFDHPPRAADLDSPSMTPQQLSRFDDALAEVRSAAGLLAAHWVIDNALGLAATPAQGAFVLSYEGLRHAGPETARGLLEQMGLDVDEHVLGARWSRPSQMASSTFERDETAGSAAPARLGPAETEEVWRVVHAGGFTCFGGDGSVDGEALRRMTRLPVLGTEGAP